MSKVTLGKSRYFVTPIDEGSGSSLLRFISRKYETHNAVNEMFREMENLFHLKTGMLTCLDRNIVEFMRSDGGGEYIEYKFQDWLNRRGIINEVMTAHSPESKGRAERLNKSLMDTTRTLMLPMPNIKYETWAEVAKTACYIRSWLMTRKPKMYSLQNSIW